MIRGTRAMTSSSAMKQRRAVAPATSQRSTRAFDFASGCTFNGALRNEGCSQIEKLHCSLGWLLGSGRLCLSLALAGTKLMRA